MMRRLLLLCAGCCLSAAAQDRSYGRSMVVSQQGIVSSTSVLASQAGVEVLARGGSAVDAGIAANAVLGVVEATMNGMGGDLFAIYWEARTGKLYGLNASGWAPKALTIDHLEAKGLHSMPENGIDSVTVPGAVDGWSKLHGRFGKLAWSELFAPAIYYADHGFTVPEFAAAYWADAASLLRTNPESRRVLLPADQAPALGQLFRNPELGATLSVIAKQGGKAFYQGEVAQAIVATSTALSGTMTADDLSQYSAAWVEPISTKYRDWTVYELPPNGDGMAALEMLNILERFPAPMEGPSSTAWLHTKIEAMKLAYADVEEYNGDPNFSSIPSGKLISKQFAAGRAQAIDAGKANCDVAAAALPRSDTTYLTVVDHDGNILSLIQSNYSYFGSGVTVLGKGFPLQNRGALFSLDRKSPDALAGRKRPFHTIIPAFMEHGDQHIGFGIMGGMNQPLAHAQFVSNVVDYHMNVQAAMEAPRFTVSEKLGCHILIESRVGSTAIQQLTAKGHLLQVLPAYASAMGRGQAILHDSTTTTNYAGSEPRADGAAVPETPAFWNPTK